MTADDVDLYVSRSTLWPDVITALRPVLLRCDMTESIKWNKPSYQHAGRNIAIIQEMKEFLSLMFFKGALIDDTDGVLEEQGANSRSAKRMVFRSVAEVEARANTIEAYVRRAIAIEDAGLSVPPPAELELVAELQARLDRDQALHAAFAALTPGRRREYHLHISGAKQSATRESRIDACTPRILAGKGLRDR
jgi:uncharacterized protein YdeI (YjbR/CyaY-like superfamily)